MRSERLVPECVAEVKARADILPPIRTAEHRSARCANVRLRSNAPGSVRGFKARIWTRRILALAEARLKLKQSGSAFVAGCPFHSESTPSFNVVPAKKFFHCFGCQKSGDAIALVKVADGWRAGVRWDPGNRHNGGAHPPCLLAFILIFILILISTA